MRSFLRAVLPLAATLASAAGLAACSSTRARSPGGTSLASEASPSLGAPSGSAAGAPLVGGEVDAAALARQTGLAYEDQGSSVLLHSADVRARFFPGSPRLTIGGSGVAMGAPARREGGGLVVPPAGAEAVRRAVSDASARRLAMPGPMARPTLPSLPPVAPPSLQPVQIAAPAPGRGAEGDPAWRVSVGERPWRWIVIHHSDDHAGCFMKYDRIHREQNGWDGCGYHFVIGNGSESGDGQVEVTDRWTTQKHGAHAKTPDNRYNDYGIGIVLVGDFERGGQPTERQYQALVRLTSWLMARYGVPVDGVLRHSDCKSTACPGKNFPWARYKSDLSK